MRLLPIVSVLGLLLSACGPSYMSPDDVRSHLLLPRGEVASDTLGNVTDDIFHTQKANDLEGFAGFVKSSESGDDSASAWAAGIVGDSDAMATAVSYGVAEDVGDIFCAASLVAAISRFDSCESDSTECEVELTIDSCIFRIGEGGDENARGRIKFRLHHQEGIDGDWERNDLDIEFDAFETSRDDGTTDYIAGIIALETNEIGDGFTEIIFSADIDTQVRSTDRGLLDDGLISRERVSAALRLTAQEGVDRSSAMVEILAFVDDTDDTRDESVVILLEAESRQIDPETEIAGATLIVRGSNGAFSCTFESVAREGDDGDSSYHSAGQCIDEETGEVFNWDAQATSSSSSS
jgi:hypothetical protein